ncbi:LCP family protein [Faecalicatena contorta]|uniref:LCP family protein n=1 Tax=Faecalicatena contorta TaxID=39482 RepID=UPI001F2A75B6|nr:LCP family protein [Faecalicatena contorta]
MEYRDQLKYIKSHQISDGTDMRKGKKMKKRKAGKLDRLLWAVQLVSSAFFAGAMVILGILPLKYMAVLIVVILLLLLLVRSMQKRALKSRKKKRSGKGIAVIASLVFLVGGFYALKVNAALDKIATGEESGQYVQAHAMEVTEQPFNVYISGIDVYGEITQESRSDVNLIATINPKTHKILLTTTPRDYYVTIPGVSGEKRDKLTHAGIYGIDTSIATLENLYETDIPFYVRVNFTSVEEIVDVMGGVDVESELAFTTGEEAGAIVEVKEGKNHFTGKEALAFVRERKALAAGDNQRGKNQQALLTGLIKQAISPMIIFRANDMINSVTGNAETNMSEAQIKSLIRMQIGDMKGWEIESMAATGDDSGKKNCYSYSGGPLYVTVPDMSSVEAIKTRMQEIMKE